MTKRRNHFTLIELLVAISLLSLIMMLLFQLFSGAQRIWIASEKTNNLYSDARVAMELVADILNTVQFSHGEKDDGSRDTTKDMIFSLDSDNKYTYDGKHYDSNSVIFVAKTARELPMKDNTTRFISFRLGEFGVGTSVAQEKEFKKTRGKLFMLIYSDKNNESTFYGFFPTYNGGSRDTALAALKNQMDSLITNFKNSTSASGENEFCQVISDNVVEFKLTAYGLNGSNQLVKKADSSDLKEVPYMIEIQMTVLDPDSYQRWIELKCNKDYLEQNKHTFTRNVYIGNRWALEAK